MTKLTFNSTIKCTGCINTVRPELDNLADVTHWEVDLTHPQRLLTVESKSGNPQWVIEALQAVGYQANPTEKA